MVNDLRCYRHLDQMFQESLYCSADRQENVIQGRVISPTVRIKGFEWPFTLFQKVYRADAEKVSKVKNNKPQSLGSFLPLSPKELPRSPLKSPKRITKPSADRESYKAQR